MALIECPECGRDVSDQAAACPHCGYPLRQAMGAERRPRKQEFEHEVRSVKRAEPEGRLRRLRRMAVGLALAGLAFLAVGAPAAVTVVSVVAGLLLYAYVRIAAWWHRD